MAILGAARGGLTSDGRAARGGRVVMFAILVASSMSSSTVYTSQLFPAGSATQTLSWRA